MKIIVHYLGQSNSLFHPYVVRIIKSVVGGGGNGKKIVVRKLEWNWKIST
jgi:hypothetical protein